jgi:hypothetical protein
MACAVCCGLSSVATGKGVIRLFGCSGTVVNGVGLAGSALHPMMQSKKKRGVFACFLCGGGDAGIFLPASPSKSF